MAVNSDQGDQLEENMLQKKSRNRVENQTSEEMQENSRIEIAPPKIPLTDAIVLAALTVFSYIFHYFFEYGYLSYFDVPTAFISFNLTEMIPAIFFLVMIYLFFVFVLWPVLTDVLAVLPGYIKTILVFIPWLIIFVYLDFSWNILLTILLGILMIFSIDQLRKYRIREKARNSIVSGPDTSQVTLETISSYDSLLSKILPSGKPIFLLYFLFFALVGSIALGRIVAMTRTSFPISDASPQCAIIYTTSERYICKPYDVNRTFENTFNIFFILESQNLQFRNENIGPLRPKPTPTAS